MAPAPSQEMTENEAIVAKAPPAKGTRFWLAMLCIMLSTFLAALDSVSRPPLNFKIRHFCSPKHIDIRCNSPPHNRRRVARCSVRLDRIRIHTRVGRRDSYVVALGQHIRSTTCLVILHPPFCSWKCVVWRCSVYEHAHWWSW